MKRAGVEFEVRTPEIAEEMRPGERPEQLTQRLAREKALAVVSQLGAAPRRWVLGADTVVVLGESVLGKPRDAEHAVRLLSSLVGQRHRVITGIALADSASRTVRSQAVESWVSMGMASENEIRAYVASGEPLDKAGAYALQGEGGRQFVDRVEGSRSNVIGLPLEETLALLADARLSEAEGEVASRPKGEPPS